MFYTKIKQSLMTVAIAVSISSATVFAQDQLSAKTVKTKTGQVVTYTNDAGKIVKKVTVTVKGNVTITVTIVYDEAGKLISKRTVAELKTDEENPKLIRREVRIENADGSTTSEVTNVTTDADGSTTTQTNSTTTNPDGSSVSTDTVTTTNSDGKTSTSSTTTTIAADGTETTETVNSGQTGGDAGLDSFESGEENVNDNPNPSEGDDAGSYTPSNSYRNVAP